MESGTNSQGSSPPVAISSPAASRVSSPGMGNGTPTSSTNSSGQSSTIASTPCRPRMKLKARSCSFQSPCSGLNRAPSLSSLDQTDKVSFAVLEPGGAMGPRRGDAIDGLEARKVVLLEDDSAQPELGDQAYKVLDVNMRLRVAARSVAAGIEQELATAIQAVEQSPGVLLNWLQPEFLGVEGSGSRDIPDW